MNVTNAGNLMSTAHNLIDYVPQDTEDHLRWRIRVREVAAKDRHVRQALYSAAMDDLPFFLAAFCWLMEPLMINAHQINRFTAIMVLLKTDVLNVVVLVIIHAKLMNHAEPISLVILMMMVMLILLI